MWCLTYLSNVVQKVTGISQGPWAPSLVPGSVSFWVIKAIVLSIFFILTFRVSASASSDELDSLSLLRVALNYWVSNDVACFNSDTLVWTVAVEATRDAPPCSYKPPNFKEASSPRSEILYHDGSRARDAPSSSEAYLSSADSWRSPYVMEGSLSDAILKTGGDNVFVRTCILLPIWRDLPAMFNVSSSLTCDHP